MSLRKWMNRIAFAQSFDYRDVELEYFVDLLNSGHPYGFSRFGDGEWNAMFDREGANCDGHEYFPDLGLCLRMSIQNPAGYFYGIQKTAIRRDGRRIAECIRRMKGNVTWYNADVFHYANRDGNLFPLLDALRKKAVIIVGPPHLSRLPAQLFEVEQFIHVPEKNCFLSVNDTIDSVREYSSCNGNGKVYAFSASMAANVMIHELFGELGADNWLIDFGSLWDPYVGVKSRGYFEEKDWEHKKAVNLDPGR